MSEDTKTIVLNKNAKKPVISFRESMPKWNSIGQVKNHMDMRRYLNTQIERQRTALTVTLNAVGFKSPLSYNLSDNTDTQQGKG